MKQKKKYFSQIVTLIFFEKVSQFLQHFLPATFSSITVNNPKEIILCSKSVFNDFSPKLSMEINMKLVFYITDQLQINNIKEYKQTLNLN